MIDLDVECEECRDSLETELEYERSGFIRIKVKPCPYCMEEKYNEGKDE